MLAFTEPVWKEEDNGICVGHAKTGMPKYIDAQWAAVRQDLNFRKGVWRRHRDVGFSPRRKMVLMFRTEVQGCHPE